MARITAFQRPDRVTVAWMVVVAIVYVGATIAVVADERLYLDRGMQLALQFAEGRLDVGEVPRLYDVVVVDGRNYLAFSLLPILPYLAFVPFPSLWASAHVVIPAGLGMIAAWLALPLARAYGPAGRPAIWLAVLAAFGTILLTQSVAANMYYLAHVEAVLVTFVALIEWRGRRRPVVLGTCFALAFLARPTVAAAALPFLVLLLWSIPPARRVSTLAMYCVPLAVAVGLTGLYNVARFGSPLESGYGLTNVSAELAALRDAGLFSVAHVVPNLGLLLTGGFSIGPTFPFVFADPHGHALLLSSPALLAAVGANLRDRTVQALWVATLIVAIPVLLYYGGGGWITFGHRYALDFVPFLIALTASAAHIRFGRLERALIVLSVISCGYGVVWYLAGAPWDITG